MGFDSSENESNLKGRRRCENESMCCKLQAGEKVKKKSSNKRTEISKMERKKSRKEGREQLLPREQ